MLKRIITNTITRVLVTLALAVIFAAWSKAAQAGVYHGKYSTSLQAKNACVSWQVSVTGNGAYNTASWCSGGDAAMKAQFPAGTGGTYWMACWDADVSQGAWGGGSSCASHITHAWEYGTCPVDQVANPTTGLCEELEEEEPYDCGVGYYNIDGGPNESSCAAIPPATVGCQNPIGYLGNDLVCGDDAAACAATGGYYGSIDETFVCIPPGDDVPQCEIGSFVFVEGEGSSGFSCLSTTPTPPDDSPDPNDWDDDGIPNGSDSDDDDDGILDSEDTDDNGDGVADTDTDSDGTNDADDDDDDGDGVADGEDGEQNGGEGDCDPYAKSYLECIGMGGDMSEAEKQIIINDAQFRWEGAMTLIAQAEEGLLEEAEGVSAPDEIGDEMLDRFQLFSYTCTDMSFPVKGNEWVITCEKTSFIRQMLGIMLGMMTLLSIWNIALSSPNK